MPLHRSLQAPLLGTSVEVVVETGLGRSAKRVATTVIAELQRLENVFNIYSLDSEICQVISLVDQQVSVGNGPGLVAVDLSPELATVLDQAAYWHEASGGRFAPMIGRAVDAWRNGQQTGAVPSETQLAELTARGHELPFHVEDGQLLASGSLAGLNVNGLAKGWILDQVVDGCGPVKSVVVNAGGDVSRRGDGELTVRIEDPARPFDNADPLTAVRLAAGGVASSGRSRRSFEINGDRFNHVLDARSGLPASEVAASSVLAPSSATADVVATVLASVGFEDARELLGSKLLQHHQVGGMVVGVDGLMATNGLWEAAQL